MIVELFSIIKEFILTKLLLISLVISVFQNRHCISNIMKLYREYDDDANNVTNDDDDFEYPSVEFSDSISNIRQIDTDIPIITESDEYYKQRLHLCRQQCGYYDKNQSISILPQELEKTNSSHWTLQWLQKYIMPTDVKFKNTTNALLKPKDIVVIANNTSSSAAAATTHSKIKGRRSIHDVRK